MDGDDILTWLHRTRQSAPIVFLAALCAAVVSHRNVRLILICGDHQIDITDTCEVAREELCRPGCWCVDGAFGDGVSDGFLADFLASLDGPLIECGHAASRQRPRKYRVRCSIRRHFPRTQCKSVDRAFSMKEVTGELRCTLTFLEAGQKRWCTCPAVQQSRDSSCSSKTTFSSSVSSAEASGFPLCSERLGREPLPPIPPVDCYVPEFGSLRSPFSSSQLAQTPLVKDPTMLPSSRRIHSPLSDASFLRDTSTDQANGASERILNGRIHGKRDERGTLTTAASSTASGIPHGDCCGLPKQLLVSSLAGCAHCPEAQYPACLSQLTALRIAASPAVLLDCACRLDEADRDLERCGHWLAHLSQGGLISMALRNEVLELLSAACSAGYRPPIAKESMHFVPQSCEWIIGMPLRFRIFLEVAEARSRPWTVFGEVFACQTPYLYAQPLVSALLPKAVTLRCPAEFIALLHQEDSRRPVQYNSSSSSSNDSFDSEEWLSSGSSCTSTSTQAKECFSPAGSRDPRRASNFSPSTFQTSEEFRLYEKELKRNEASYRWEDTSAFKEFRNSVNVEIMNMGGVAYPKLNWSSPKDATWVSSHGMRCFRFRDLITLCKASTWIAHDLDSAYDECGDLLLCSRCRINTKWALSLRKAQDAFSIESEFRYFFFGKRVLGASQRDLKTSYPRLQERGLQVEIIHAIRRFHEEKLWPALRYGADWGSCLDIKADGECSVPQLCRGAVDVHYSEMQRASVSMIDISPWGAWTNPLLYTWQELAKLVLRLATSERFKSPASLVGKFDRGGSKCDFALRVVLPNETSHNEEWRRRYPEELLECFQGGGNVEALKEIME